MFALVAVTEAIVVEPTLIVMVLFVPALKASVTSKKTFKICAPAGIANMFVAVLSANVVALD
jgi:hypothetical protein